MKIELDKMNRKGSNVCRKRNDEFYKTLKGSNVYRNSFAIIDTTPSGSHVGEVIGFYKHQIPSGLTISPTSGKWVSKKNYFANPKDSNVCRNKIELDKMNRKGSNVYRKRNDEFYKTLKGSNGYRNSISIIYTTPSGSHVVCDGFFYKHQIPSGLTIIFPTTGKWGSKKNYFANPKDSNVCKNEN
ncbi:MAG: hypothetical protein JST23_00830 [Bacteroidetes bacterium]|nr:hypothetical protein [Bacteroidota bacterium]